MEDLLARLGERFRLTIEERCVTEEHVTFKLPAPLA